MCESNNRVEKALAIKFWPSTTCTILVKQDCRYFLDDPILFVSDCLPVPVSSFCLFFFFKFWPASTSRVPAACAGPAGWWARWWPSVRWCAPRLLWRPPGLLRWCGTWSPGRRCPAAPASRSGTRASATAAAYCVQHEQVFLFCVLLSLEHFVAPRSIRASLLGRFELETKSFRFWERLRIHGCS